MKLHVCCGDVYLRDYINIDIQGRVKSTSLIDVYIETTLDKYYVNPHSFIPKEKRGDFVIDQKVDILLKWPYLDNTIEEIVMIQALEHFNYTDGCFIIKEIYRVLKPDGKFIFDFPDLIRTFEEYRTDYDKLVQLVYCNHKDLFAAHKIAYNEESFTRLLNKEDRKWNIEFKEVVKHDYPVIGGVAIKCK